MWDVTAISARAAADRVQMPPQVTVDPRAGYDRLTTKGVRFLQPPVDHGPVVTAVLDDTCGNLIQIAQEKSQS